MTKLAKVEYVDDGMYNQQWNIYEADGRVFAHAFSEHAAYEIFHGINAVREQETEATL